MFWSEETLLPSLVEKVQVEIDKLPVTKMAELTRKLDIDLDELAVWQNRKNLAMMEGVISQEVAQQLYVYMGETPDKFNRQPLAVKIVTTRLMTELLGRALNKG